MDRIEWRYCTSADHHRQHDGPAYARENHRETAVSAGKVSLLRGNRNRAEGDLMDAYRSGRQR